MVRQAWPFLVDDKEIVRSAGGIVTRDHPLEILLVHNAKHNEWTLPKGHVEEGESLEETALREVLEESACLCSLGEKLATLRYLDRSGKPKEVHFWKMDLVESRRFTANDEIDDIRWLAFAKAKRTLTFKTDKLLLKRAFGGREED